MATDVVMPQMGESVAEGTVVRWIKKVGDHVDRDEPLFEISTDKVDAEIPSPVAGVLVEIRVQEGETVPVDSVVAVIGDAASVPAPAPAAAPAAAPALAPEPPRLPVAAPTPAPTPAPAPVPPAHGVLEPGILERGDEALRQRSSPLVRRIAKEHGVDISRIQGTGIGGRVSKEDILGFIESGQSGQASPDGRPAQAASAARVEPPVPGSAVPGPAAPVTARPASAPPSADHPVADRVEKMSVMRKKIAEHMVASRRTSAHVHTVFEVNFSRVAEIREAKKADYERAGAKLTYLSFVIKAVADALRATPVINASIDGDSVVYHKDINVGIAVALDWGLIVPVIKNADDKDLRGLSGAVADLATRARAKQLKPDDVSGGTFTITNPGGFGALFGMPIINQPQVAILGVGVVEKRAVVVNDAIGIRPMAYLTLGYDHRIIDGAAADEFLSHIKKAIENWDPKQA